jgi:hypothetical protein
MFADSQMHSGKTSDNAIKIIKEFDDDIVKYSQLAKKFLGTKDKKCDALAIWPEEVLVYCNIEAEKNGYGNDELNYCTCFEGDSNKLTQRIADSPRGNAASNYEKFDFKDGPPKKKKEVASILPVVGKCYRFNSVNFPDNSITARDDTSIWADEEREKSSVWKCTEGQDSKIPNGLSFENVMYPGQFIRKWEDTLVYNAEQYNPRTNTDSTWLPKVNAKGTGINFEASNKPRYFMRHQGYRLKVHPYDSDSLYAADSTWTPHEVDC